MSNNTNNLAANCVTAESSETPKSLADMATSNIEKEDEKDLIELIESGYFQFDSAQKLDATLTAGIISASFEATRGRTRRPQENYFDVMDKLVFGVVNDIKFIAYFSGHHFNIVIKDFDGDFEDEVLIAMEYETGFDEWNKKVVLPRKMQDKAENIFARLPF